METPQRPKVSKHKTIGQIKVNEKDRTKRTGK